MRQYISGILGALLSGSIFGAMAAPTTSLPPAPPPSAFIHGINAHPASVHVNDKALKHKKKTAVKKNIRSRENPEKGRKITRKK